MKKKKKIEKIFFNYKIKSYMNKITPESVR